MNLLASVCVVFGRTVLVAVVAVAALGYLAICLGQALEAMSFKPKVTDR